MYLILSLLGWIVGIAMMGQVIPHWFNTLFPVCIVLVCILMTTGIFKFKLAQHIYYKSVLGVLLACCSFMAGAYYTDHALQKRLNTRIQYAEPLTATVYIAQMNQWVLDDTSGNRVRQKAWLLNPAHEPVQLMLNIKEKVTGAEMQPGQYYQVSGQLRPNHGYAIAGTFDQERWMLQENLMGSLQVKSIQTLTSAEVMAQGNGRFVQQQTAWSAQLKLKVELLRTQFRDYIQRQPYNQKGLMLALLTGDESLLSKETQALFKRLGISHLLAISGPHVLIFAILFCFVIKLLLNRWWPQIYLRLARPYVLLLPFLVCVWFYTAFVGFEIPAMRTLLTVGLLSLVVILRQRLSALPVLLISAALLLCFDPFSILSAAFWLSYGACLILIRVYQTIQQQALKQPVLMQDGTVLEQPISYCQQVAWMLKVLVESQWKIFIALFPLVILIFHQVSWLAPIANLIAIPLIATVIVPLEVVGALLWLIFAPAGMLFFQLADLGLQFLVMLLSWIDFPQGQALQWLAMNVVMLMGVALAIIILFLPKGTVPKVWAVICLVPLCVPQSDSSPFRLTVLDVGQGQAIFLDLPEQKMMIDTGGYYDEAKFSVGQQLIIPYLMQQGINQLDKVLLTHLDQDHSGAFERVAQVVKIHEVYSNQRDARFDQSNFQYCHAGQQWQYQGVKLTVLAPQQSELPNVPHQQNELSCIVYIQVPQAHNYQNYLLMGDAGWEAEYKLLQQYPDLQVDVLVLGHHGSQNSSSFAFLKRLQPKLAIASAGFNNRYGHPHPIVLARLKALNIPLKTTIDAGSIQFILNADDQIEVREFRQSRKRLAP